MSSRAAVILAFGLLLVVPAMARAQGSNETRTLGLEYSSSHGCSQSFARTSFYGSLVLTLKGRAASLVLSGRHSYSMGPSLGRFRRSGGRDKTHHTASTILLTWKGTVRHKGGALLLELTQEPSRCKTEHGYHHTTAYACTAPKTMELHCESALVPVYPPSSTPGAGYYPAKTERTTRVKALRCVPSGKDLGLMEHLRFESGFPMGPGAGLVHHHGGMGWSKHSALRFPGKRTR